MTRTCTDQLRWQLTPDYTVALDDQNRIVAEVGGQRALIDRPAMAAEAFRQAKAAQTGAYHDTDDLVSEVIGLRSFARQVAEMRKDGENDGNGEPFVMENDDTWETLSGLIDQARDMLGIINPYPEPDPDPCSEADLGVDVGEERAKFRWNIHYLPSGAWCRWSHVPVSAEAAARDDKRCPFECPDSTIEPTQKPLQLAQMDHGSHVLPAEGLPPEAGQ